VKQPKPILPVGRQVSTWKRFRHRLEFAGVRLLTRLIPCFSFAAVTKFGRFIGRVAYFFDKKRRLIALANLDTAFGDTKSRAEKHKIARKSYENFGATALSLFWSPRLTRENLEKIACFDESEVAHVRKLSQRGVIYVAFHFGNWEILGVATAHLIGPLHVVAQDMKNARLTDVFNGLRAASGNRIVPKKYAVPKLWKALRRGEAVALLVDFNTRPHEGAVWANYFGLPVLMTRAVESLASHTGAAVVACYATREADGRVRLRYREISAGDAGLSQACMDFCEKLVRAQPELWLWSYKRWMFRPTEEGGRYPYYSQRIRF
jgi:KDO2-lipid IV(A) lauroyltransferase